MKSNKKLYIVLFLLCLAGLLLLKLIDNNIIPTPKIITNSPIISIVFVLLCGTGMIWWGISDLKKVKSRNKNKLNNENKLFGIFLKIPSNPIVTLSYGRIMGGIMGIIFVIIWILTYGIK